MYGGPIFASLRPYIDVKDPASLNVAKFQKVGTFLEVVVGTLVAVAAVQCAARLAVGFLPLQLGSALVQLHQRLPGIVRRSAWPAHATECDGCPERQAGIKPGILEFLPAVLYRFALAFT